MMGNYFVMSTRFNKSKASDFGLISKDANKVSPETERKLLEVVDEIQQCLLLPEKSSAKQICKEVTTWQQQASDPSKDG